VRPTYDAAGNVQTLTTTLAAVGTAAGGTETQAFCYDWAERLIWAGTSGTGPCGQTGSEGISGAGYTASYSYDTLGRISSASVLNGSGGSLAGVAQGSYTYDATHVHGVASVGSGATGYAASYDAAGNLTCRAVGATSCGSGNEQLTYDPLGRLLTWQNAATSPTASEQDAYDGSGQRVWQQASSTSGSKTTTTSVTYVLGVEEVSTSVVGNKQPTTSTLSYYQLAGGLSASRDSSGLIVQMSDLLGTPIAALNLASGLVGEQLRTPYGQARYSAAASSGGGMHTTFGFTGQREDTQTAGSNGLYYFNARYFDPVIGRFTSADPTRPDLGSPWGTAAYGYVGGRVESATDPSGREEIIEVRCLGGHVLGRGNLCELGVRRDQGDASTRPRA
jgi:RHS repeat-associated protein